MKDKKINSEKETEDTLARRELLTKYGPYTAPLVISMLIPSEAYGHNTGQPYSTSATCVADPAGGTMHGPTMTGHCMINGAMGGNQTHPVSNPGPP